jgi:hypothetical protein
VAAVIESQPHPSPDSASASFASSYRLYSLEGIIVGTIIGSIVTGAYLLWSNWRSIGDPESARSVVKYGFFGAVVVFGAIWLVPETWDVVAITIYIAQPAVVYLFAHITQADALEKHAKSGATFYSWQRAAGVAFLVNLAMIALLVVIVVGWLYLSGAFQWEDQVHTGGLSQRALPIG